MSTVTQHSIQSTSDICLKTSLISRTLATARPEEHIPGVVGVHKLSTPANLSRTPVRPADPPDWLASPSIPRAKYSDGELSARGIRRPGSPVPSGHASTEFPSCLIELDDVMDDAGLLDTPASRLVGVWPIMDMRFDKGADVIEGKGLVALILLITKGAPRTQ
ncbi:uncharacterized protein N7500_008386 [Penicillium coprophilum]|uniref:uncharacterized protein n=1 Tax=Penicillium coprophilum TaxID=36646 RepID=UPI00239748BB|nr:uncharacterized protein N7500_008386 [Penicillium coprophilum]KAJ5158735.1 hypothetical protein N7500_008386 [Penicillium coprophilum]